MMARQDSRKLLLLLLDESFLFGEGSCPELDGSFFLGEGS
jgi:hypothetical protein